MAQKYNSDVQKFLKDAGLKVLAVAHLNQVQYSLVLYILNTAVSGLQHFLSNASELANLSAFTEEEVNEALRSLSERQIIRLKSKDKSTHPTLQITFEYDLSKWQLDVHKSKASSSDAVVFPFRRLGSPSLKVLDGEKKSRSKKEMDEIPTWLRVVEHFRNSQESEDFEIQHLEHDARMLVETHPVDEILILIRHFGSRIPTLSLLASSWHHFQEIFEEETQKVDLLDARSKYHEQNEKLRQNAEKFLTDKREELSLDEITVLEILMKHRHPRRQLFWAYQMRSRYEGLKSFLSDAAAMMLPISSSGGIVKRPPNS